jgi:hypothetical protein
MATPSKALSISERKHKSLVIVVAFFKDGTKEFLDFLLELMSPKPPPLDDKFIKQRKILFLFQKGTECYSGFGSGGYGQLPTSSGVEFHCNFIGTPCNNINGRL